MLIEDRSEPGHGSIPKATLHACPIISTLSEILQRSTTVAINLPPFSTRLLPTRVRDPSPGFALEGEMADADTHSSTDDLPRETEHRQLRKFLLLFLRFRIIDAM